MCESVLRVPFESQPKSFLDGRAIFHDCNTVLVFTHPYAPLGGNMENNVVLKLFHYFAKEGFNVVRFNFRGVGVSEGSSSWTALPETDDVRAVCKYILDTHSAITHIVLVVKTFFVLPATTHPPEYLFFFFLFLSQGYSFGAVCASAVVDDFPQVSSLFLDLPFL